MVDLCTFCSLPGLVMASPRACICLSCARLAAKTLSPEPMHNDGEDIRAELWRLRDWINRSMPGYQEAPPTAGEIALHAARYPAKGVRRLERPAGLWLVLNPFRIDGMTFPLGVGDDGKTPVIVGGHDCAPNPAPGVLFRPLDHTGAGVPWPYPSDADDAVPVVPRGRAP